MSYILKGNPAGFFANFCLVIGALEAFDHGYIEGVSVQFDDELIHFYIDPSYGPNWWEYYFESIAIGNMKDRVLLSPSQTVKYMQYARWTMSITYANYLINKYIIIKKEILDEVEDFCEQNSFETHYMIGVHYRGTDKTFKYPKAKRAEAESVTCDEIFVFMDKEREKHPNYKFFIASDEQGFVEAAILRFGDDAVYRKQVRSTTHKGVHYMKEIPNYTKGREALIDCLLLSHCKTLIRMSSNLSACSPMFNPNLEIITVNPPNYRMKRIF